MKNIVILGASGSIGRQTLDVVSHLNGLTPDRFRICAITGNCDWQFLAETARRFMPALVAIGDETHAADLAAALADLPISVRSGEEGLQQAAAWEEADMVVAAISGMAGLKPLLAAIEAGKKQIALANKEALVSAGEIVTGLVKENNITLLPVDSEHSAIWQCLSGEKNADVSRLILTASGGPFREFSSAQLAKIKPFQALAHPTWVMGPKITIDSATMVNKGLEIIEAHWLFNMPYDQIEVIVHPESIVHSLVAFSDGSVKGLLSVPDMRLPIQYALTEQGRPEASFPRLDLAQIGKLTFFPPDTERFPALSIFRSAGEMGGTAPAYLNGANELLVNAFLQGKISLIAISAILGKLLQGYKYKEAPDINAIYTADKQGRRAVRALIK